MFHKCCCREKLYTEDPPAALQAGYYKCTSDVMDALFNAVGIASGNIGEFPVVIILSIYVIETLCNMYHIHVYRNCAAGVCIVGYINCNLFSIGLIIPLLVVILMPLTYLWLSTFGYVQPKEEYDEQEVSYEILLHSFFKLY